MRGLDRAPAPSARQEQAPRNQGQGGLRFEERVETLKDRLEARADSRQAAELRQDVAEARGFVKGWKEGDISTETAGRYQKTVEAMQQAGERPENANCKSTFEFRRAALVHTARSEVKGALRDLDKARRGGGIKAGAAAYSRLKSGLATLRQYPPSTGNREEDLKRRSRFQGPPRPVEGGNGKRTSIQSLPSGWRDDLQKHVNLKDRPAVAVMSSTGCRPAEVKGIKVRQDDNKIFVEIRGAKFDEDRGVDRRVIELNKEDLQNTEAGRDLADWLGNRDCRTVSHEGGLAAFRERVSRAADRAGLEGVSAYSLRHQRAHDLKEAGVDREEIARQLGHRSDRSQSVYG